MNLQDLRTELTTRAEESADRQPDLLPGIHDKIRRTKQRRTATALASVVAAAILAVTIVPGVLNTSTPDPADNIPPDFVKDGQKVPGMVKSDKLLKAWIGDKAQSKVSFAWTPTTDRIIVRAACDGRGFGGPQSVRIWIGDWFAGTQGCFDTVDWGSDIYSFGPDAPLWLDAPVGKAVKVTAQVVDSGTGKIASPSPQLMLGLYSDGSQPDIGNGAPYRRPAVGPDDFQANGVVYRKQIGGDTLLGAAVGEPAQSAVHFSFTSTGARSILHSFCTASSDSAEPSPPYRVETFFDNKLVSTTTCNASSTDGGSGTGHTVAGVPAGQKVGVIARVVATGKNMSVPDHVRLGLGLYAEGKQRIVDGIAIPERVEAGGYDYQLADVRTAPAPSRRLTVATPADQPFVIAYGTSALGIPGMARANLSFRGDSSDIGTESGTETGLGVGRSVYGGGPADRATLTMSLGKPTKGQLFIGIYLPV